MPKKDCKNDTRSVGNLFTVETSVQKIALENNLNWAPVKLRKLSGIALVLLNFEL